MNKKISLTVAAICALAVAGVTLAQATPGSTPTAFKIDAPAMSQALLQFTEQSRLQLAFASDAPLQLKAPKVEGTLTPRAALDELLKGTGLKYEFVNDRTVSIRKADEVEKLSDKTSSNAVASIFRIAQAQDPSSSRTASEGTDRNGERSSAVVPTADDGKLIEQVVVTGSRLDIPPGQGAQDVRIYGREQIDRSGQTTIADFLSTTPNVSVSVTETVFQKAFGGTTVQLRGLPVGTTLVLIDGHRVQTSGTQSSENFFDLNNIPMAAVERIEVLANGASAVYGSDAIAGVVNIVLRKNLTGLQVNGSYGSADDFSETLSSLAWGHEWERGHVSITGSYQTRDELSGADRAITASNDYRGVGGPNNNILYACSPGTVFFPNGFSFNGQPPVSYAAIPAGIVGRPGVQDFAATAGAQNQCPFFSSTTSLIPETKRWGALVDAEYRMGAAATAFAQILYSRTNSFINVAPRVLGAGGPNTFVLAASNPYNPFGVNVGISMALPDIQAQDATTTFVRPLLGMRGTLSQSWNWEIAAFQSRDETDDIEPNVFAFNPAIRSALASSNPATALNPFASIPVELLDTFSADGTVKFDSRSEGVTGFVRGAVFELPAGNVSAVIGAEANRDRLHANYVNYPFRPANDQTTNTRRASAFFAEARVPILGSSDRANHAIDLALTLAARHDRYDDFGSTTNPQVGLEFRPFESILFRATYAEAFKAPSLFQLYAPRLTATFTVLDPRTGQNVGGVSAITGGNRNLRPEEGDSTSAGVVYTSAVVPGLQLSATHWQVEQRGRISNLSGGVQYFLDHESAFPDRVVRDANGVVTSIDATSVNFGAIDVAGIDYQLSYEKSTSVGKWFSSASVAQTYKYETQLLVDSPFIDRTSKADIAGWAPRWKANAVLGWSRGEYSANLSARWVGHYQDYGSTREMGNFAFLDANIRVGLTDLLKAHSAVVSRAYIEFGGVNLTNRLPEYSGFSQFLGYDPTQADIRGRLLYFRAGLHL